MNLIQIQERLKDTPTQAVMQYANGNNPLVPPYLALAELQRRDSINKSAQNQQAMAQGKQPSVKEQVEQAAGLAALQKQMQAKGLQSLLGASVPTPPVPTPERQPEREGVSSLPVEEMFNFKDGGIVAFADGGNEGMEELLTPEQLRKQYEQARYAGDFQEATRIFKLLNERQAAEKAAAPRTVKVPVAEMDMAPQPASQPATQPALQADKFGFRGDVSDISRQIASIPNPEDRQRAAMQLQQELAAGNPDLRTARPQPAPEQEFARTSGISSVLPTPTQIEGADEAEKMMLGAMREKATPQSVYEAQRELSGLYGLKDQYGEDRMRRLQEMQAGRQKMLESRDMERLIRVLSGAGQRGLAGLAPAYIQTMEGERASDVAFQRQMDELLANVEDKRRAEQVSRMKGAQEQLTKKEETALGVAEKISGQQRRREEEMFKFRLEQQLKMMQPNEAAILQQVMADIKRRNPDMPLEEIYGKARAAQQGATPELRQQEQRLKAIKAATDEWNDITVSKAVKNPNNLPKEQWIAQKVADIEQMSKGQFGDIVIPDALKATAAQYGVK